MDLSGKAAIVTGGADGIGLASAERMAQLGARVMLVDIDADKLDAAVSRMKALGHEVVGQHADVSDEGDVRAYVEAAKSHFGRIDGFFNNAGIIPRYYGVLWDCPADDFDRTIAVNVRGVFLGLKYVIPVMIAQGGGAIVNTASMGAAGGIPGSSPYVASKHAVVGLTKNAALEAATAKVRVNAVLPGNIVTRMSGLGTPGEKANQERLAAMVPAGHMGMPSDIAEAVCFLMSDAATYITGIELPVDGGILAASYGNMFNISRPEN
ncbi:hypothetical protein NSU_3510 [Novosphingobium pentaromativorans US6-1]|uniref:Ketoreductase domain-containing protein n=1 Tax=Novosphingobium pentaromativorans US6-1 TaxID=1088721 RepID=G6EGH6_9SPHN|nr:hypothetical protein NSU_3510 [Novosphingobium pentaromativorans US6-1]